MRLLLLEGGAGIAVPVNESKFTVQCAPTWESTLERLQMRVDASGVPITHLEIHSHGMPGILKICQYIDSTNVESFAAALNTVMSPWGYIELLACRVAQHPILELGGPWGVLTESQPEISMENAASVHAQHQQLLPEIASLPPTTMSRGTALNYFEPMFDAELRKAKNNPLSRPNIGTQTWQSVGLEQYGDSYRIASRAGLNAEERLTELSPKAHKVAEDQIKEALLTKDFGQKDNGLDFCLRMARASQCIVRASDLAQSESWDGTRWRNRPDTAEFDTFGDWEGRVWDFMPDGSVTYLGFCPPRFGLPFPALWSGSLAYV